MLITLYDFTESYIQIELLKLEVEDMEDIFLIEEIHELGYNEEVEEAIEDFWLHGNRLDKRQREVLVSFYILNYVEYLMEE